MSNRPEEPEPEGFLNPCGISHMGINVIRNEFVEDEATLTERRDFIR